MIHFFSQLIKNLGRSFSFKKIPWHVLAIVFTYGLAISGFDWWYFTHTRSAPLQSILFPAAVVGGMVPFVAPFVVYAWGKMQKNIAQIRVALALGQAAILGFLISGFYKAFTGRIQPPLRGALIDNSLGFRFGFWRGGVFWGWPSTHTTVAFAMAITLFILFPKNKWIRFFSVVYALYIGVGVSTNIHWLSDFVAGAIIGSVIGVVVGKSFLKKSWRILKPDRQEYEGIVKMDNEADAPFWAVCTPQEAKMIKLGNLKIEDLIEFEKTSSQLILKDGNKIVGHIVYEIKNDDIVWVSFFWVRIGEQRRGYGTELLKAVEGEAKKINAKIVVLESVKKANWAIKFYLKNGYSILSEADLQKNFYAKVVTKKPPDFICMLAKNL